MSFVKYILVCIVIFFVHETSAHERSLNHFNCHKDRVSGDHCHPEGNYDETIYHESTEEEIILSKVSDEEIKEFLKKDKTCREFIKNSWEENALERCEDILQVGEIYGNSDIKEILIGHTNCFEFKKFKGNYAECDKLVTQGVYSQEELEVVSKGYKKCEYISGHLYVDKDLCLRYREEKVIEQKKQAEQLEQQKNQDIKEFELSTDMMKKLDKVNLYLQNIYMEKPNGLENLFIKINKSKKKLAINDHRYAALKYIEEYLRSIIIP